MASDVNNITTIKQLLNNSINEKHYDYISKVLEKNVNDCNLLYTQVCYLIKLFLLNDYENKLIKYNDYKFDEHFIRKCFILIKTQQLKNEDDDNQNSLLNRLIKFYDDYNKDVNNKFKFIKPNDVSSIIHITDALSRDIQTNITNNIILNYHKYIKEYVNVNLKLEFTNINNNQVIKIYNDIINNTLYSDINYHLWINEHKKLIIPNFNIKIHIETFKDGIDNHNHIFNNFICKYVKENQILLNLININNHNKNETIKLILKKIKNECNEENDLNNYDNWIDENKNLIVNEFNLSNKIDLDKELEKNPYLFIPNMLFMNKNLELNNSKKKYQIIPLRTNLTPKFIPININSFVDIIDSEYLLGNIKNYYHNDNKKGLILFETYFKFDSKYIKNTIKKGCVFSGLIYTNGYEINYIFNSKSYEINKNNFHSKGKQNIKFIKENTKNLTQEQKNEFIKIHNEKKEKNKKEIKDNNKEKIKKIKQTEKDNLNNILKLLENELLKLTNEYKDNIIKIENEHYKNLKLEFDKIDKTKNENKKIMDEIMNKLNDIFVTKNVYLKHEYDRNYSSLINDYENTIDIKYDELKKKDLNNNNSITKLKDKITKLKKELDELKKEKFNSINKEYKKETRKINLNINNNKKNKKILKRLVNKIIKKMDLLDYETINNKSLTIIHTINIIENISKMLLKIKEMNVTESLNKYLNDLGNIEEHLLSNSNDIIKNTINLCFKYLSVDKLNNNESQDIIKLMNCRLKKIEQKEQIKTNEWYIKYDDKTKKLNLLSIELNKLIDKKKKIENEIFELFKDKNKENIKVDNMSKKVLLILNKMNWAVIDPGVNSILTIMSKDNKTKLSYSKCYYINKTKRKQTLKKIEKIKKDNITKLENKLTKETTRLKTSNIYKNFNEYFNLKMSIHNEIVKLYQDKRLNKLKWFSFINEKRSETDLINKIKNKFGNDVVLILGDWSMNKNVIKSISIPNKKYEKILNKHFLVLKLNEFRTSIIENKTELKCENLIKKMDYKKMNIKEIYLLEKLKEKNIKKYEKKMSDKKIHKILTCKTSSKFIKYINRDINAVKNMSKIVSSYILNNKKPISFVMGTKICNNIENII